MTKDYESVHKAVSDYIQSNTEVNAKFQTFDQQTQQHLLNCSTDIVFYNLNDEFLGGGGFTQAFLRNNLEQVIARADSANKQFLVEHMVILKNISL